MKIEKRNSKELFKSIQILLTIETSDERKALLDMARMNVSIPQLFHGSNKKHIYIIF